MNKDLKWKALLTLVVIVLAGVYLMFRHGDINEGIDLQGGLHLILEVQTDEVVNNEIERMKGVLSQELKKERIKFESITITGLNAIKITAASPEEFKKITTYIDEKFSNFEKKNVLTTGNSITIGLRDNIVETWKENAVKQSLLTLRKRVDELGLTEPLIQRQGQKRVIIELAGEKDPQRAIDLLQTTAQLRFQLVKDASVSEKKLLEGYNSKIPDGMEILPTAPEAIANNNTPMFYLVEKEASVTGADLDDARVSSDDMGLPAVSFEFDSSGARRFGTLTENNIGTRLAIVLDGEVQSAPAIRSRITNRGQITGDFTSQEANDLAIVLRAGALPATVKILQNTSVGATLGEDSVKAGQNAIMIGGGLVIIFMILYYKFSGVIADISLLFNLLFILSILAYFKATLTLPGLAGIALTVGMAVDANVLIFERIKEEMRRGKTLRSAVENGFSRAHLTILDANLTTLLAAVVLFQFGTGPVKGFAVTLSIGIVSTLFTALILSKVIFDLLLQVGNFKRLSI